MSLDGYQNCENNALGHSIGQIYLTANDTCSFWPRDCDYQGCFWKMVFVFGRNEVWAVFVVARGKGENKVCWWKSFCSNDKFCYWFWGLSKSEKMKFLNFLQFSQAWAMSTFGLAGLIKQRRASEWSFIQFIYCIHLSYNLFIVLIFHKVYQLYSFFSLCYVPMPLSVFSQSKCAGHWKSCAISTEKALWIF